MSFVGIVCGLQTEQRVVNAAYRDPRIRIGVSGANADRAEIIAAKFCEQGAGLIISVGISGGLLPAFEPGDFVIGKSVVTSTGEAFDCDIDALGLLARSHKADGTNPSIIYGSDEVILNPKEKQALFNQTGARSVDMESHGAARAATHANVPFLALRAIADPASRTRPPAALDAVNSDGSTKIFSTLIKAAKDPGQFPDLVQLGQDSEKALETLRRNLGGLFGVLLLGSNLV